MPPPWFIALTADGDLKRAGELLQDETDWFEVGMRGRVASLALEEETSHQCFEAVAERWGREQSSDPVDILRYALISAFDFENLLLWNEGDSRETDPARDVRSIAHDLVDSQGTFLTGGGTRAWALLTLGREEEAIKLYRQVLALVTGTPRAHASIGSSDQALWHCGCACALANLGESDEALAELEKAGLAACAAKHVVYQGLLAARLAALYDGLESEAERDSWLAMLHRLEMPPHTKEVFERRTAMMSTRRDREGRLVLL